jgi:hypothetical protein
MASDSLQNIWGDLQGEVVFYNNIIRNFEPVGEELVGLVCILECHFNIDSLIFRHCPTKSPAD